MPNSIVFWCQACCVERYDAFFKSKGVTIEVKSIEHYLETCQIERENAAFIQQEYTKIILDPARNKIIDRVYFKDMFFKNIGCFGIIPVCAANGFGHNFIYQAKAFHIDRG